MKNSVHKQISFTQPHYGIFFSSKPIYIVKNIQYLYKNIQYIYVFINLRCILWLRGNNRKFYGIFRGKINSSPSCWQVAQIITQRSVSWVILVFCLLLKHTYNILKLNKSTKIVFYNFKGVQDVFQILFYINLYWLFRFDDLILKSAYLYTLAKQTIHHTVTPVYFSNFVSWFIFHNLHLLLMNEGLDLEKCLKREEFRVIFLNNFLLAFCSKGNFEIS